MKERAHHLGVRLVPVTENREGARAAPRPLVHAEQLEARAIGVAECQRARAAPRQPVARQHAFDPVPEFADRHARKAFLSPADLRDRLKGEHAEDVAVPKAPFDDVRDIVEVLAGDRQCRRRTKRKACPPARQADHVGAFLAQRLQGFFVARVLVTEPASLRDVDMDRDLGEPALSHQVLQEGWLAAKCVAVGHHHRNQANVPRVPKDRHEVPGGQQRDLAIRNLRVPLRPEPCPELIELTERLLQADRTNGVRLGAEIAAGAREVAAWMDANCGAAPGCLLSETLPQHAPPRVERLPSRTHQPLLLLGNGLSEEAKGSLQCGHLAILCALRPSRGNERGDRRPVGWA